MDWEKQRKFKRLGQHLGKVLGERYGVSFHLEQGYNANRFLLYSERPADPYIEVEFTNEEQLAVSASDGEHYPAYTGICSMVNCMVFYEDGFWFDFEKITSAAQRMLDLGCILYTEHVEREHAQRRYLPGSVKELLGRAYEEA